MNFKNFKKFINIFNYVKPNKPFYFFILILDCLSEIIFYLLWPIVMKLMIDAAVNSDMNALMKGLYLTLFVTIFGMIMFVTEEFFLFSSFQKTTNNIRQTLFKTILRLPVSFVEQNHSGDTLSRLTNDTGNMQNIYGWQFRVMLVTLASGFGAATVMFILDWRMSILLIAMGLLSVFINAKQTENIRGISDRMQKSIGKFTESLSNIIGGFITIKSLNMEKAMLNKAHDINNDICDSNIKITKKSAVLEARNFLFSSLNFIGVIILASFLAIKGVGSLGSVVSTIFLLGHVNKMFSEINGMILKLQGYLAASDRVIELMETKVEPESMNIEDVKGSSAAIDLKDIRFSYDGENMVLNSVSLTIEKGQVVALVGPSGGGKSTIVKILMGFYLPMAGKITIGGKSLKNMTMAELRELTAYVPQESYIFDGTIGENIRYGRMQASKEEIIAAAKAAHADEFIQEMEKGYDTLVGERGIKLSGGQRQRIAIARAFLKNAPILLLDEATSSLDSESEQCVQDALNVLMKDRTTLIIAHRLSTIENADTIFVVKDGEIIEQGNHNSLIAQDCLYRRLYTLQFCET